MHTFWLIALLWGTGPAFAQDTPQRITVTIPALAADPGPVYLRLYGSEDSWLKHPLREQKCPVGPTPLTCTFEQVPPGEWAISAFHDQDSDGELGVGWLIPIPAEGVGTSNNPRPRIGPPRWSDAVFTVGQEPVQLEISLVY